MAGIIPAALNALRQDRPGMTLSLIEALTPALIEHVHERDLDVAVVTDEPGGRAASQRGLYPPARRGGPVSSRRRHH